VLIEPKPARQGTQLLRLLHRQRVVHLLRVSGPLSRADVADKLGLARSSVTAIVRDLIEDGTLIELASGTDGSARRGRPRILLSTNPGARRLLGIQIDARHARVVVADATGNILQEGETSTGKRAAASVIRSIARLGKQLIEKAGGPVAVAGVCIPGYVDAPTGTVMRSEVLGWANVPVGQSLSQQLGIPVAVRDLTQATTLAEAIAGEARGARSAVVLDYGGSVGIGLIIDGRPYYGATGFAGAIGHIPVHGGSSPCLCGRTGCLEAQMSMHAMHSAAPDTQGIPVEDIDLEAAAREARQNPDSPEIVRPVIDQVAHIAVLIEAFIDPEVLILAGLIVEFDELADALETRIEELRPAERQGRTRIARSRLSRDYYGASVLVALQHLDPDIAGLVSTQGR
jgi:predicted NBD/HSP70 family sugar kinase